MKITTEQLINIIHGYFHLLDGTGEPDDITLETGLSLNQCDKIYKPYQELADAYYAEYNTNGLNIDLEWPASNKKDGKLIDAANKLAEKLRISGKL
jgi:hypothetical protein